MNKFTKSIAAAAMVLSLTGCAAAAQTNSEVSEAAVQEFGAYGYSVEDVTENGNKVSFKAVGEDGGANVSVTRFDDLMSAVEAYDQEKAVMTQSDYYMLAEQENGAGSVAVFNNSINYVNAIVAFDAKNSNMIVVREISQTNMDQVYDYLAKFGFRFQ